MSIDFEIPAEAKAIREKVRKWVHDECIPAEKELDTKPLAEVLGPLRKKARAQGLWCPWVPKEYGGMGLGPLANALVQMELGESMLGALSMNTQGPDDASMMTILAHGTEYQKEKFLKPLLNGDKRICFSMTEKAAGADATGMQTISGEGRQRELHPQRREMVLVFRQRRRHGAGGGPDRSERAAPQAAFDLHRGVAEPRLQDQAQRRQHGDRRPACRRDPRRPLRDRDQGSESAGRQPARRRRQRFQHGPAPPRLWPASPRHAQRRQGAARARHGGGPCHHSAPPSARCSATARACSSCSPIAPANSISAG